MESLYRPTSLRQCFNFDDCELNPTPKSWKKIFGVFLYTRYSMSVWLRLAQYFWGKKHLRAPSIYGLLELISRRMNVVLNNFDHPGDVQAGQKIIFHHPSVIFAAGVKIEPEVHVFGGVTLGRKGGGRPHIGRGARLCGHCIVLGQIRVGTRAIVAPGAVVLANVENETVVAGVPAKVLRKARPEDYDF